MLPESTGPRFGQTVRWILVLMALTATLRGVQILRTEVPSRDTLQFVRIAWNLEHGQLGSVLRESMHHPGYPATILPISWLVRPCFPNDPAYAMQLSAQLASGLASIFLVIPAFLLGRMLFSTRVAFWAALLFQFLPASGRILGDGLSEPLFLLLLMSGMVLSFRALESGLIWQFAGAGLFGGLAYLTRPEGAVLVPATLLVLLLLPWVPAWRLPGRTILAGGVAVSLAALVVAGPFMLTIGGLSTKMAAMKAMQTTAIIPPVTGGPVVLALWRVGDNLDSTAKHLWSLKSFATVLLDGFFHVFLLLALLGLFWFRDRFQKHPGSWMLAFVGLGIVAALYRVSFVMGYVSERHLLVVVLCGMFWAVAALEYLAEGLVMALPAWPRLQRSLVMTAVLGPLVLGTAWKCSLPLHRERLGFREAGYWLARNADPTETIVDPFGWSSYYAGQWFREPRPVSNSPVEAPPRYVILEETGNQHPHLKGWAMAQDLVQKKQGRLVHTWPVPRGKILLYELPTGSP